ncbi:hypothetical protein B0H14DRAFT_3625274 [Mycena olivaceomarginata]|nr:hypothetical protein B0H14DRAFT_3625274 [Mycena olivaceomarginata]
MALIVPILRLIMLLLNMYDTFKVLKIPRPSARNSGQPTVRALSQRKRNMKGCLAVWIVWCCFMIYERLVEGIVSLFVPFYDEVKSLALLFLIFTRARGAEPIFLHIIRPITEALHLNPGRPAGLSWWHSLFARRESAAEDETNGSLYTDVQQALHSRTMQLPPPPYVATESPPEAGYLRTKSGTLHVRHITTKRMTLPQSPRKPSVRAEDTGRMAPISAISVCVSSDPAPRFFDPVQGFGQSLPSPHELPNSGSARDSSDDDNVTGIQNTSSHAATTALPDDATMDEDEEEEDDFNGPIPPPGLGTLVAAALASLADVFENTLASLADIFGNTFAANAKPAVRRGRRVVGQPIGIGISTATSDVDEDDEDGDADGGSEPHSPFMKKRRVNAASAAPAPSRVQPRRTTRSASKEAGERCSPDYDFETAAASQNTGT